jgi:hypothetical protein
MSLRFQYVPMNGVGVLGVNTDVLKTGGVGTCIVLIFEYSAGDTKKYALSHVPYDSDALALKEGAGVIDYLKAVLKLLGDPAPDATKVTVIQNTMNHSTSNKLMDFIKEGLKHLQFKNVTAELYATSKRMAVALRKNGQYFCYASNKLDFIDECELADGANKRGSNLVAELDVKKRSEKHNFRRHADLYANARGTHPSLPQNSNPYMLALKGGTGSSPFLAKAELFTRAKTTHWTKKNAKPPEFTTYEDWENTIRSKILTKQ